MVIESIYDLWRSQSGCELTSGSYLLAVSGGCDSTFLLHLFVEARLRGHVDSLRLFHLDHQLRAAESTSDARFVAQMATRLDVAAEIVSLEVSRFATCHRLSIEQAGRALRYRTAVRLLRPGEQLVTAHHADDYLETLLIHLIRGGGESAFATLPLRSTLYGMTLYRPLVVLRRHEIEQALADLALDYVYDTSNESRDYLRNRLRSDVTPHLVSEGLDPRRLWRHLHPNLSSNSLWPPLPGRRLGPHRQPTPLERGAISLPLALFSQIDERSARELLRVALHQIGLPPIAQSALLALRQALADWPRRSGPLHLQQGQLCLWGSLRGGQLWLLRRDGLLYRRFTVVRRIGSDYQLEYGGRHQTIRLSDDESLESFEPGLCYPIGDRQHRRKLKKYLSELSLPPPVRGNLPLVIDRRRALVVRVCRSLWDGESDIFL